MDNASEELVSIITPNWNCGKFIAKTIESVQAQTYKNWEMLIQDDCSKDDSIEVAKMYAKNDPRIKIEINPKNSGAAITRNNALKRAKGKWIAFLDSDDLWEPQKLEKQVNFMRQNQLSFSYHEYIEIDEENKPLGITVSGKEKVSKFDMFSCCWPGCLTVMYNADEVGLIQINDVKKNNDTAIWLKVIKKTNCYLLKESLAQYRRRKGSITPPGIKDRIYWHYRLFRDAENMSPVKASFWMCMNVIGSLYKKVLYVHKSK